MQCFLSIVLRPDYLAFGRSANHGAVLTPAESISRGDPDATDCPIVPGRDKLSGSEWPFPWRRRMPPDIVWDVIETPSGPQARRLGRPTRAPSPSASATLHATPVEVGGGTGREQVNQHDLVVLQTDQDGKSATACS